MNILVKLMLVITYTSSLMAAPKANYYDSAKSLSGYKLKTALNKILTRTHKTRSYDDLFDIYFKSDIDLTYDKDGSIVDIYSENPHSYDTYTYAKQKHKCGNYKKEADCFNREHIFPQGVFGRAKPMRSDFFHIFATDGYVNGRRGSYPFGEVKNPMWTSANGSKLGPNTTPGYNGKVFEPIDEFKGDVARALLYFATRYENKVKRWRHQMINSTSDQVYKLWFIKLLMKWHKMDPVSAHEKRRNDVGETFQGNRNPFIDNPQWVEQIWSELK